MRHSAPSATDQKGNMHEVLTPPRAKEHLIDEIACRYYDTATKAAEALDGVMHSEFPLGYDGNDIYSRKDGTRYGVMMQNSLIAAEEMVRENPDVEYELRRRRLEAEELPIMLDMMDGHGQNTVVVVSDFPPELMNATHDVGGYNASRKQTMLRIIARNEAGELTLITQTLDRSDRRALEAIYETFGFTAEPGELLGQRIHVDLTDDNQSQLSGRLVNEYDKQLAKQYGGQWSAGRAVDSSTLRINTYDFVREQDDVLLPYVHSGMYGDPNAEYGMMQLLSERYRAATKLAVVQPEYARQEGNIAFTDTQLIYALRQAAVHARSEGKVFSACGETITLTDRVENDYQEAGYGNKSKEELAATDRFGPLTFECPKGHKNTRPRNTLIECCKSCGVSVKC